ncbi:MAG: hypothetical protein NW226_01510 [Microscillaceae bacterium]|nr:hypothetical protein [Microscillaceae bacterium]
MKKIASFLILFLSFFSQISAQIEQYPLGARSIAMGTASLTLQDQWAFFNNPSGTASLEDASVFFAYENRFGVSAFQTFGVGGVLPLKIGTVGAGVSRFGDELYNELKAGVSFSKKIDMVSLGLKVNYVQVAIRDLNSKGALVLEFGGLVQITKQIYLAGYIYNLNQAKFKTAFEQDELIPTILKAGLGYQPIKPLFISIETVKDIDLPASFNAGVEYQIVKNLNFRTGIQTEPFRNHFGLGFSPKTFHFDYALSTGNDLGLSHHISFGYRFTKK